MGWQKSMVKPLPRPKKPPVRITTLNRGAGHFPAPIKIFQKKLTDENFFPGDLAGEWGSAIISVWLHVRDAVKNLAENRFVGVQNIAASLASSQVGVNVMPKDLRNIITNIVNPGMVEMPRSKPQLINVIKNVLDVVRRMIYSSLTLNRFGLEVSTNG